MVQWEVRTHRDGHTHVRFDGDREMYPSEPRHHWVRSDNKFADKGYVVSCTHCSRVMLRDGSHSRTCYGRGRP